MGAPCLAKARVLLKEQQFSALDNLLSREFSQLVFPRMSSVEPAHPLRLWTFIIKRPKGRGYKDKSSQLHAHVLREYPQPRVNIWQLFQKMKVNFQWAPLLLNTQCSRDVNVSYTLHFYETSAQTAREDPSRKFWHRSLDSLRPLCCTATSIPTMTVKLMKQVQKYIKKRNQDNFEGIFYERSPEILEDLKKKVVHQTRQPKMIVTQSSIHHPDQSHLTRVPHTLWA